MSQTIPPPSVGQVFGRLKVVLPICWIKKGQAKRARAAVVRCTCTTPSALFTVRLVDLRRGDRTSCGCITRESMEQAEARRQKRRANSTRHGDAGHGKRHPLYATWVGIVARCTRPNCKDYRFYGAKGTRVHQDWLGNGGYLRFKRYILQTIGDHPGQGWSIDRKEPHGHYEPGNLRWATQRQQCRNQRKTVWVTYQGQRMCLADALEITGLARSTVNHRRWRGWPESRWFDPVD